MENENTEYMHGDADEFTIFLFSEKPKEKNSIKLELSPSKKDIHIGVCNLSSINWVNRSCDIAIIMGNKDFKFGPYLTESFSLLIRIAFLRLNLRIIKSHFYNIFLFQR